MSFSQFHGVMWLYELAVLATVFIGGEGQQSCYDAYRNSTLNMGRFVTVVMGDTLTETTLPGLV